MTHLVLLLGVLISIAIFFFVLMWLRRRLPEDAAPLATSGVVELARAALPGVFMLVGVGTFGLRQVQRQLTMLAQSGLADLVGSVLIVENDTTMRALFAKGVPPIFHGRIRYGYSESYDGGAGNRTPAWVLDRIATWGPPIRRATAETIDLHLRRNANRAPSVILAWISLGGQAPMGTLVIEDLRGRFGEPLIICASALPRHEVLRETFAMLKPLYDTHGVDGWILADNLGADPTTADFGQVGLITALADAALHADQGTQPNNVFTLALGRQSSGILIYQVVPETVVAYPFRPIPFLPPRKYFVYRQPVIEATLRALHRAAEFQGVWSADLPIGADGSSTFDDVLLALYHDDIRSVQDAVTAGREEERKTRQQLGTVPRAGELFGAPNYETQFAGFATTIDPGQPVCPIVVIRLTAICSEDLSLAEIVKVPTARVLPALSPGQIANSRQSFVVLPDHASQLSESFDSAQKGVH